MAKFEGTLQDFHLYLGPKIRNSVTTWTKKNRNELHGICQQCDEKRELDAAHMHGRSRKNIIEIVMDKYKSDDGLYIIPNLRTIVTEIKTEHLPIEKNFYFLCPKCHREYDANPKNTIKKSKISQKINSFKNIIKIPSDTVPKEILSENEKRSWKFKLGWTSNQNRKNIEELISKIDSAFDCRSLACKSWYYHNRSDNDKQFSGIICNKNRSTINFRLKSDSFKINDERIILCKKWFFSKGKEAQIEIIPKNHDLIMKCLSHAYNISA